MKCTLLLASLVCLLGSGCATILKSSRNDVVFDQAPRDLRAYSQGVEVPLQEVSSSGDTVKLKGTVPGNAQEVSLRTQGVEVPVQLEKSVGAGWVIADLLLTGLVGVIIDAWTGRWSSVDEVNVGVVVAKARGSGGPTWAAPAPSAPPPVKSSDPPRPVVFDPAPAAAVPISARSEPSQRAPVLRSGKLAVLDFKSYANDFKPEDVRYFTDLVRGATLRASPDLQVMTRENLLVLLQATGKDLGQCEGECEVDTGRRIGADAVVSGEVLKVGTRYKMSLRLHETQNGRLLSTAIASGKTVDELDENLQKAAEDLLKPAR
jgi:hypothetical protein